MPFIVESTNDWLCDLFLRCDELVLAVDEVVVISDNTSLVQMQQIHKLLEGNEFKTSRRLVVVTKVNFYLDRLSEATGSKTISPA